MAKTYFLSFFAVFVFYIAFPQEKTEVLTEVAIKKEKNAITNKNGNLKIDVANSVYKSVPNAIDLLAKLPNVQVSPNKEIITVIGKGSPLLYIDNQVVTINDLNSLSVDDIKSIEIIANPSSKYEANGRVVLLIARKWSKKDGFKTIVSENASCQKYFNNYFGINSSLKKNSFEFKANFNYNQITVWESNGNDFTIPSNAIVSNYLVKAITRRPQILFGTGFFYKINDDDYLSINCNERTQKDIFDITTDTYNQQQSIVNYIHTLNANDEHRNLFNGFVNYSHKMKSIDGVVFTGFQYANFNQKIGSVISNNFNENGFELAQYRNQKFDISVFSGRMDFEKEFKNKMKFELGMLYLKADAKTNIQIENRNPNTFNDSHYEYNETNAAAYSQFSGSIKKVNYSIGLRAENTIAKGKYASETNLSIDKNYINLFPKAQVEIPVNNSTTFFFNYAKSINRPNFSSTSQGAAYINPYFVWSNNINLDPTLIDEVSFSYLYKNKSLRLAYNKMKNPVYYATSYNELQNILTFQTANFTKESGFTLELTLPFEYKFWSTTTSISSIINKIEDNQSVVNQSKPYLYYYSNHVFRLPKGYEMMLTSWGLTHRKEGVFERNALVTLDLAVSKNFFKNLDGTISYNDIFRQIKYTENFTINGVSAKGIYYTDANLVSFSVKYTFGKIKKSEYKDKTVDENSNRIR